jgi:glycerol-3-phosphate dehydrogenase
LTGLGVEGGRVRWADVEDVRSGGRERVEVNFLASAAGYWAGRVAALAGVKVEIAPGWGTKVVMKELL